jgi:hypothetical protein
MKHKTFGQKKKHVPPGPTTRHSAPNHALWPTSSWPSTANWITVADEVKSTTRCVTGADTPGSGSLSIVP